MNIRAQQIIVWNGVLSIIVFFIGFWPLARFFPPLSPAWDAAQIGSYYLENAIGIRLGAILVLYSAGMLVLFYSVISHQIARIEGRFGPLSIAQIALAVLAVTPFIPAAVSMSVATFRPDRELADILMWSDYTWMMFFMIAPPAMFQYFVIGYAILTDTSATPIFPRWLGFFTIWAAILSMPGVVIVFFHTGPFAWSGIFGFYIPSILFGSWTIVMAWMLLKIIKKESVEYS